MTATPASQPDPDATQWRRSSFCNFGDCVEVTRLADGAVSMRSSRDPSRSLAVTADEWAAFTAGVRAGEFDAGATANPELAVAPTPDEAAARPMTAARVLLLRRLQVPVDDDLAVLDVVDNLLAGLAAAEARVAAQQPVIDAACEVVTMWRSITLAWGPPVSTLREVYPGFTRGLDALSGSVEADTPAEPDAGVRLAGILAAQTYRDWAALADALGLPADDERDVEYLIEEVIGIRAERDALRAATSRREEAGTPAAEPGRLTCRTCGVAIRTSPVTRGHWWHLRAPLGGGDWDHDAQPHTRLVARCGGYDEVRDRPCPGRLRFVWGMDDAPCDTCGGPCGIAVAQWERVEGTPAAEPAPDGVFEWAVNQIARMVGGPFRTGDAYASSVVAAARRALAGAGAPTEPADDRPQRLVAERDGKPGCPEIVLLDGFYRDRCDLGVDECHRHGRFAVRAEPADDTAQEATS